MRRRNYIYNYTHILTLSPISLSLSLSCCSLAPISSADAFPILLEALRRRRRRFWWRLPSVEDERRRGEEDVRFCQKKNWILNQCWRPPAGALVVSCKKWTKKCLFLPSTLTFDAKTLKPCRRREFVDICDVQKRYFFCFPSQSKQKTAISCFLLKWQLHDSRRHRRRWNEKHFTSNEWFASKK